MAKMNREQIEQLQPSDEVYQVKLTRLYEPEPVLVFEGPSRLHIQRKNPSKKYPNGLLCVITTKDFNWAEGCSLDISEEGSIVVENYLMEIFYR